MRYFEIECMQGTSTTTFYRLTVWAADARHAFDRARLMGYQPVAVVTASPRRTAARADGRRKQQGGAFEIPSYRRF